MNKSKYDVYKAIKTYIKENGYSPSMRELCEMTGKKSPATVHLHLRNLRKLGYIDFDDGKCRTIKILKDFKCNYE